MTTPPLPEQIELHHRRWHRDEDLRVESAIDAERFVEEVGFANKRSEIRSQRSGFGVSVFGRLSPETSRKSQIDPVAIAPGTDSIAQNSWTCMKKQPVLNPIGALLSSTGAIIYS